ncbi:hypothetical protein V6Z11_D02G078500 [Gossypium hirsutum]
MKAELVFMPMPCKGHFVSMVQLAKILVNLYPNLSIPVLIMKLNLDAKISASVDSFTATRIKFIHLSPPETHKDVAPADFITSLVLIHGPLVKEVTANIVKYSSSVIDSHRLAVFILNFFLTPLINLGNELGVPSYVFYLSAVAFQDEQNVNIVELKDSSTKFTIPSYLNLVLSKLSPTVMLKPKSLPMVNNLVRRLRKAKGIMINTFWELESHAVSSLSYGSVPPIYPVGSILDLDNESEVHQSSDIMKWLDEQPISSVVFLYFGRGGGVTGYDDASEVLPEGFLDWTHDIAKIIGWALQVAILGHSAVGGFISHCGWNSMLESILFRVPMYVMEHNSDARKSVKEMSEKSRKALIDSGYSHSTIHDFINDVIDNMFKKN